MGWELRRSGYYLYHPYRDDAGRSCKTYLGSLRQGKQFVEELQHTLREKQNLSRQECQDYQMLLSSRSQDLSVLLQNLHSAAEAILKCLGYHRPKRGRWRMKRFTTNGPDRGIENHPPVVFMPPKSDTEALEIFAQARNGVPGAIDRLRALLNNRDWLVWMTDFGQLNADRLIRNLADGDPVFREVLNVRVSSLRSELDQGNASLVESLLIDRVICAWIQVQGLQMESGFRPPKNPRMQTQLNKALGQAEKRFARSIQDLLRVRNLQTLQTPRTLGPRVASIYVKDVFGQSQSLD